MKHLVNKGSIGCAFGIAVMSASLALMMIIFIKCFGPAFQEEYTLSQYISALFSPHALVWYLGIGILFSIGLWMTINALITIFKEFFEV